MLAHAHGLTAWASMHVDVIEADEFRVTNDKRHELA